MQPTFRHDAYFNYEFGLGIHIYYIPMERHCGPLPDLDPDLFAGFSLGNDGTDMEWRVKPLSVFGWVSASEDVVDRASL